MEREDIDAFKSLFYRGQEGFSVFEGGQYRFEKRELTDYYITRHLDGQITLGLCPVYFNNVCAWGCLDFDSTSKLDPWPLVDFLPSYFIVSTSKSGGLHAYLLFKRPVSAEAAIFWLKKFASGAQSLYPEAKIEVFPKQTYLGEGSQGSTVALPYGVGGCWLTKKSKKDASKTIFLGQKTVKSLDFWQEMPPCLDTYVAAEGMRNSYLFNVGVFSKKVGLSLKNIASEYSDPPLAGRELTMLEKSIEKAEYNYSCNAEPCASLCNRELCETRFYGILHKRAEKVEQSLTELKQSFDKLMLSYVERCYRYLGDIVIWEFHIKKGGPAPVIVKMATDEALNLKKFQYRVLEMAQVIVEVDPVLKKNWTPLMAEFLANVETIEISEGATLLGKVRVELSDFLKRCYKVSTPAERSQAFDKGYSFVEKVGNEPETVYFLGKQLLWHIKRMRTDIDIRQTAFYVALAQLGASPRVVRMGGGSTRSMFSVAVADLERQGIGFSREKLPTRLQAIQAEQETKDNY